MGHPTEYIPPQGIGPQQSLFPWGDELALHVDGVGVAGGKLGCDHRQEEEDCQQQGRQPQE